MKKYNRNITGVLVAVHILGRHDTELSKGEVLIEIGSSDQFSTSKLIEACQRAVANAIEEMENRLSA